MTINRCRFCDAHLDCMIADLGMSPPSNALVDSSAALNAETYYPLQLYFCTNCHLVQLPQFQEPAEIFGDYPYFSSYSTSWLEHVRRYARTARERFGLGRDSLVVELASNDGHLLQAFRESGIPVLGVEPAKNVAAVAVAAGVQTVTEFFGKGLATALAGEGHAADLVVANNVLAHVPKLNDFVAGIRELLKPRGVATLEFPHVARLLANGEFDTIYHEHFSYFSLQCVVRIFDTHGLAVFDVEELPTHGGSLRVYASRATAGFARSAAVERILESERAAGLESAEAYLPLECKAREAKRAFLRFLVDAAAAGTRVAGYGAPAKATTLLNYCGVRHDLIAFTVDRNPHKQNKLIPGVHIPIHAPQVIFERKPDFIVIFPWNIAQEICHDLSAVRAWGARFVVPIPTTTVLP